MTHTNSQTRGTRVAILVERNFEDAEFQVLNTALKRAGAEVVVLGSRMNEELRGKQGKVSVRPDGTTTEAIAEDFDAVVIPGGYAPDTMRTNAKTVHFVQQAMNAGKLIAAVCHGPQVLIEGDLLRGHRATGFRAIRKDLQNAGAEFVDEPVVIDGNLITSRRPGDLPIFATAILQNLGLRVPETTLPDINDREAGWWKLSEAWGGSTKREIVDALNTVLAGDRYTLEAFEHYAQRAKSEEMRRLLGSLCADKRRHIQTLEERLKVLGESPSLQATASSAYAKVMSFLQGDLDDLALLRRALGDLQTGVVDTYNLSNRLTDPVTVHIFDQIEIDLAHDETRVADLYRSLTHGTPRPAQPTTGTAASSG
ncbi:DJ-1/PfpI/YhbO family deglycase/protease [Anthocerotibacter panamensis]|uniref:DJ-1/PfpI/YhbO family deglycase/protease n=1 Tax=Anthocerotibacter panamensis TaxID=2857077 RepID=UPI001C407DC6|nr:DJ-1/PfpI/YhbO family deglycase/protease [Anthocerotibacter panamensis]